VVRDIRSGIFWTWQDAYVKEACPALAQLEDLAAHGFASQKALTTAAQTRAAWTGLRVAGQGSKPACRPLQLSAGLAEREWLEAQA
jgi:hypothetical protein